MLKVLQSLIDMNDQNILKVRNLIDQLEKQSAPKVEMDKLRAQLVIMEKGQKKLKRKVTKIAKSKTKGEIIIPSHKENTNG